MHFPFSRPGHVTVGRGGEQVDGSQLVEHRGGSGASRHHLLPLMPVQDWAAVVVGVAVLVRRVGHAVLQDSQQVRRRDAHARRHQLTSFA